MKTFDEFYTQKLFREVAEQIVENDVPLDMVEKLLKNEFDGDQMSQMSQMGQQQQPDQGQQQAQQQVNNTMASLQQMLRGMQESGQELEKFSTKFKEMQENLRMMLGGLQQQLTMLVR